MKNIGLILVAAALVMAFRPDLSRFILTNENDANANITAPPRALQKIVAPIRDTKWDADDAKRLSEFYLALADVIERDENGIVKSSAEVRLINERSGRLCFGKTGIAGRYPRLAEDIDVVIGYGIGSKRIDGKWESVEITGTNRKSLAEAVRAVAWACGE